MSSLNSIAHAWQRIRRKSESPSAAPVPAEKTPEPPEYDWTYNEDGMKTVHNCDFLTDERFARAYQLGKATGSWGGYDVRWRAYVVCWAAAKGRELDGDYVECGVERGGYSRAVIDYIDFAALPHKNFYLVDTYKGIPDEFMEEENRALLAGRYSDCYEEARQTFAPFTNAVLVRGRVPDILPEVKAAKVCFLSIDMNTAAPSVAAAEYFWDKMSSGAAMVLDDYGFSWFIRQKHVFDDFARRKNVEVLSLPTGQGLIFKP